MISSKLPSVGILVSMLGLAASFLLVSCVGLARRTSSLPVTIMVRDALSSTPVPKARIIIQWEDNPYIVDKGHLVLYTDSAGQTQITSENVRLKGVASPLLGVTIGVRRIQVGADGYQPLILARPTIEEMTAIVLFPRRTPHE